MPLTRVSASDFNYAMNQCCIIGLQHLISVVNLLYITFVDNSRFHEYSSALCFMILECCLICFKCSC